MSKLIEKRIESAASKLSAAHPSLKFKLTDFGAGHGEIGVTAKHGRTFIVDTTLDRSFGVRELVAEVEHMIERALVMSGRTLDDETAQGRAAEDPEPAVTPAPEPLLADTPPAEDLPDQVDGGVVELSPEEFNRQVEQTVDKSIERVMQASPHGSMVLNIDATVRFLDPFTAHVRVYGGTRLSVSALAELAVHAIAEQIGDFSSWGVVATWPESNKIATTVQMRRLPFA